MEKVSCIYCSYKRYKAGILTYVHVYIPWIVHHVSIFYLVMSVVQVFNRKYHINSAPTNSKSADILTYPYVYVPWIVNHFSILYPVISVVQVFDRNQTEKLFYVHTLQTTQKIIFQGLSRPILCKSIIFQSR